MIERSLLVAVGLTASLGAAGCAQLVGADFDDPQARQSSAGKNDPATPPVYLKALRPQIEAEFGFTTAMDAKSLLVTAPFENEGELTRVGATYYFDLAAPARAAFRIVLPDAHAGDGVIPRWVIPKGYIDADWGSLRVALSDELVVIGVAAEGSASVEDPADTSAPASGAVYVYERAHLDGPPIQRLKSPRVESGALFGTCVALSGERLAVGADLEDNPDAPDSGAVYVYEWRNGRFDVNVDNVKRVRPEVVHATDEFGIALDLEGDLLVVGAITESSASTDIDGDPNDTSRPGAGAAYAYRLIEGEWKLEAYVKPAQTDLGGFFGGPISISGGRFAVGAVGESSFCPGETTAGGAAYVVSQTNGAWELERCFAPRSRPSRTFFGFGLALYDKRLVVGAPWDFSGRADDPTDTSMKLAGAAYVFDQDVGGVWKETAYLKAPNLGLEQAFGTSVALTREHLVIAAPWESGGQSGSSANMFDISLKTAGAAFLFTNDSL